MAKKAPLKPVNKYVLVYPSEQKYVTEAKALAKAKSFMEDDPYSSVTSIYVAKLTKVVTAPKVATIVGDV